VTGCKLPRTSGQMLVTSYVVAYDQGLVPESSRLVASKLTRKHEEPKDMHKLLEAEDATATETRMITVHSGDKVMPLRAAYTSRRRDCSQNHVPPYRPAVERAATGSYRHFEQ
jgi:hypothetical protein